MCITCNTHYKFHENQNRQAKICFRESWRAAFAGLVERRMHSLDILETCPPMIEWSQYRRILRQDRKANIVIKIVADSTHYLPPKLVAQYDIRSVPINLVFGTQVYREGIDIDTERFFQRLASDPLFPTTSQPAPEAFLETWQTLLDAGHEIVTIVLSGQITSVAETARALLDRLPLGAPVSIVDSRSTAMGLGFQVLRAAELAQEGCSRSEIVAAIERMQSGIHIVLVPDSLDNLRRGGRISNGRAFLGTVLHIKPLLSFSRGFVEPLEQVRTSRRARARLLELTHEFLGNDQHPWIAVMHSRSPERAQSLLDELEPHYPGARFFFSEIGPTLGVHLGIGGTGIIACRSSVLRTEENNNE